MRLRRWLLEKIDTALCNYLGLEQEKTCPVTVQMINNKLFVTHITSFKRHAIKESWDNFDALHMQEIAPGDREKLGLAIGKAIAKDLVISFEEPTIRNP